MSKSYKFVDHTADIAVEISGSSLNDLFEAGAEAWFHSIVDEVIVEDDDVIELEISASSIEELLVTFLNELNYLLITKKWLCTSIQILKIFDDADGCELSAELKGIKLRNDLRLKLEIKSVTYHKLDIIQRDGKYSTLIVFDI